MCHGLQVSLFGFLPPVFPNYRVPQPPCLVRRVHLVERFVILNHKLDQHGIPAVNLRKHRANKAQTGVSGQRPVNKIKALKVLIEASGSDRVIKGAIQADTEVKVFNLSQVKQHNLRVVQDKDDFQGDPGGDPDDHKEDPGV